MGYLRLKPSLLKNSSSTFSLGISPKVNTIMRLEFELATTMLQSRTLATLPRELPFVPVKKFMEWSLKKLLLSTCGTSSVFKQNKVDMNSKFSFEIDFLTKAKEPT